MFHVKELSPEIICVPVDVEAVWVLLTPKNLTQNSKFKKIAVASLYYTNATRRTDFLDHISASYSILQAKYGGSLGLILAGDFNRLKIKPILHLNPGLKQVVTSFTRRNPDAILDLIITNMHMFYQQPSTLEPLDNDINGLGKPSDHLPVVWKPPTAKNPSQDKNPATRNITRLQLCIKLENNELRNMICSYF